MGFGGKTSGGGGGEFVPRFTSGHQTIASSSSGNLVVLTPPAGQKVKLNFLAISGAATEIGITITSGATEVVNSKILADFTTNADNEFVIAEGMQGTAPAGNTAGLIPPIVGKADEAITVIKDSGSTGNVIKYNYQFGD